MSRTGTEIDGETGVGRRGAEFQFLVLGNTKLGHDRDTAVRKEVARITRERINTGQHPNTNYPCV